MRVYHGHASPTDLRACRAAAPSYEHGIMWSDPDRIVQRDEPYAVDNGAYSGFDPERFEVMLSEVDGMPRPPEFVVLPDVMDDFEATKDRHDEWRCILEAEGLPYYAVGQPPAEPAEVAGLADSVGAEGIFLGGSRSSWKFETADAIEDYPVHIGNPGLGPNLRHAETVGCASVDTTSIVVNGGYHHLERLETEQTLAEVGNG